MNNTQTKTKLIPKLRFKEFEGDWRYSKIEDFFVFKNGLNKEKEYFGRGTPIINFMDVYKLTNIQKDDINGLVELTKKEIERFDTQKGDVFFTRTSETINDIGMSATLIEDIPNAVFSGFVLRARPLDNSFLPNFCSYLFNINPVRKEITTKSSMTTRALTSGTLLNKVYFYFPTDKKEQQKIATFLTAVDTKLQQLGQKKELLANYKKAVIQQLFPSSSSGQVQLRFKNDDGLDFPDWEEKKLGDVFKINAGGDIKKENASKIKTDKFKYPIYANSEKKKGLYGYSDLYKIDFDCITVTGRGSLGVANARKEKFYPIVRLLVLKPKEKSDVLFFENLINQLNIFCESTGVPQLTGPQISTYKIKYPCFKEQQKIANYLSAIDNKITNIQTQIDNTQAFKKGLLQGMFV